MASNKYVYILLILVQFACFAGESTLNFKNCIAFLFESHKYDVRNIATRTIAKNEFSHDAERVARVTTSLPQEFFGPQDCAALKHFDPFLEDTYRASCLGDYESLVKLATLYNQFIQHPNFLHLEAADKRHERLQILIKERQKEALHGIREGKKRAREWQ
jgi:hypothetical protein